MSTDLFDDPRLRFLAVLVLVAAGLLLATGSWPVRVMAWDVFVLLDGGWRMFLGQVPHRDYSSAIGILPQALVAGAMALCGPTARALAQGPALILPLVFLAAAGCARGRLPPREAALFTAAATFLWVGPFPHGVLPWWTSYAMYYNRMSWSLLMMLTLVALHPREERRDFRDGTIAGVLISLLFLTKINYFAASLALVALGILGRPGARARLAAGLTLGAVLTLLAAVLGLRADIPAQIADLRTLGKCFGLEAHLLAYAWTWKRHPLLLLFVTLWTWLALRTNTRENPTGFIFLVPSAALLLTGVVVMMLNMNDSTTPLLGLAFLSLGESLRRAGITGRSVRLVTLLTFVGLGSSFVLDFGGLVGVGTWKLLRAPALPPYHRIHTTTLEDLVFVAPSPETAVETAAFAVALDREWPPKLDAVLYAQAVNDGLLLLLRETQAQGSIVALDFINPFNVGLGLVPPRGAALSWHWARTLCPANAPDAATTLAEADWVMVPRFRVLDDSGSFLYHTFKEHLDRHYAELGSSRFWLLLGKKK